MLICAKILPEQILIILRCRTKTVIPQFARRFPICMAFLHEYRFCRLDFFIQLLQAVRRRFIFFFCLCRLFRFTADAALIFCIGFDLRIGQ